jgi:hypothetical protein
MQECHAAAVGVAQQSACPSSFLIDQLAPHLAGLARQRHEALTVFDIGANKGYTTLAAFRRFAGKGPTPMEWHAELLRQFPAAKPGPALTCGGCCDCAARAPAPLARPAAVSVHAFDILQSNTRWLRHALATFALNATVVLAAATNETGTAAVPRRQRVGEETYFALPGRRAARLPKLLTTVRAVRLDEYVDRQLPPRAIVHLAAIDAEGLDPLVLEGLRGTLAAERVALLQFEYSEKNYWKEPGSLKAVLDRLGNLSYSCFWHQDSGCLLPASGTCWLPAFEFRQWSNLACASERHGVLQQLRRVAARCRTPAGRAAVSDKVSKGLGAPRHSAQSHGAVLRGMVRRACEADDPDQPRNHHPDFVYEARPTARARRRRRLL